MTFSSDQLKTYIAETMRMSHVYQPVMLRVLLEQGGSASLTDIARALLSHDQSQVEYYELRTKNMVGRVLTANGVVQPIKSGRQITGYELNTAALTDSERRELLALCEQRLADFLSKRGGSVWQHRSSADGYVPGSVRYQVLKRARYRCELCGAHENQAARECPTFCV